jgi:hypothetical protein
MGAAPAPHSGTRVARTAGSSRSSRRPAFEGFFAEMGEASDSGRYADPTVVGRRYGVEFDLGSIERICEEHGLRHQDTANLPRGKMGSGTHNVLFYAVRTFTTSAPTTS